MKYDPIVTTFEPRSAAEIMRNAAAIRAKLGVYQAPKLSRVRPPAPPPRTTEMELRDAVMAERQKRTAAIRQDYADGLKSVAIIGAVSLHSRMTVQSILGPSRLWFLVEARGVAMILMRRFLAPPMNGYAEIGRRLGGRDHTTVTSWMNKVSSNPPVADLDAVTDILGLPRQDWT